MVLCSLTSIPLLHKVRMQAHLRSSSAPETLVRETPTRMPCQMHLRGVGVGV